MTGTWNRPYLNAEGALVKVCRTCQTEKSAVEFNYHDKRKSDARRPECKECEAAYTRAWRERNPERVLAGSRKGTRVAMATARGRLDNRITVGIWSFLKGLAPSSGVFSDLGYTGENLRSHLESSFYGNMSWENYNRFGWHIDHRIPKVAFDYESPVDPQFRECWALSNLQPLWWHENAWKGARFKPANDNYQLNHSGIREAA